MGQVKQEFITRLKKLTTSELSDALDKHGISGQALGIKAIFNPDRIVGPAFTLSYLPKGESDGNVGDFIDEVAPGSIVVIDNRGREDCTVWGNILCEVAKKRDLSGVVIDGACRDANLASEIGFPVYAKAAHFRTGKDRVVLESVNAPVAIANVRVECNDIVVADAGGVVVIPLSRVKQVLTTAEQIAKDEDGIVDAVKQGQLLKAARVTYGYHHLQTADDGHNEF